MKVNRLTLSTLDINQFAGIAALQGKLPLRDEIMSGLTQIDVSLSTFKAIEAARLSFTESHDDIVRRMLATKKSRAGQPLREIARNTPPAQRRRGNISVDLFGRNVPVANLKAAYIAVLNGLIRHKPSLFELLAHEGTKRRRWIAREAAGLYPESPHLARDHALAITGDWFIDTNLSRAQIDQRLETACTLSGYRYRQDVTIIGM
jgi:hypothetical protein